MIIQILLILFWLGAVPFCTGVGLNGLIKKEYRSLNTIFIIGYMADMALFECLYLVFLLCGKSFFILWPVYGAASVLLAIISVIFGIDFFRKLKKPHFAVGACIFSAVVLLQIVMRFVNGVTDGDDAYFLATAVTTFHSGTMFRVNAYTGAMVVDLSDMRHALAGIPIYLAALAKLTHTHPTALAHTAFAIQALIVHYMIIWEIGRRLLKDKQQFVPFFATFVAIFNIYGNVSLYTAQTFLLTRTWQGKTLYANLSIPFILLILLWLSDYAKEEKRIYGTFVILSIMMVAASCMTTGAIAMLPVYLILGSIILGIVRKRGIVPLGSVLACIPMGLIGLLYYFMR